MSLRLITWDVKDTLLRVRVPVGQQYYAEAKKRGLCVNPGTLETSFRNAYRSHSRLFPNYGLAQGMSSRQWWLDVVLQTFRLSGIEDSDTVQSLAKQLYQDFSTAHNWALVPGAREALDSCTNLGLRMAVISNFDRRLEELLRQCCLERYFDFVVTAESAGVAKPHLGIFHKALSLAKVPPHQAVHVGDDYVNDYCAARMVGMHSYLIHPKTPPKLQWNIPEEHVIQSPEQLIPKLVGVLKNSMT
ncbi:haloacid dehalogenase-like hydrolase domain-containing protein 3 [Xenopus laevis]|uniref:Haloacid dehalogenase-like hydrolase domain-containing protein 3 n=2 Tax=Xenopus laevis TaxID=8355 RepID=HDHD3_XENLA|nr:haloacid dehalogenase-like hydrolase domain-containing protein 3 [Xenopus laevis]Q5HZL9.1 RecName: Full=Haloacid dehalogenase-like hydrolase domain-containing protein 3 [Xenopus laevis]AAH88963.1 LOC496361 protein [Xenopus laevis]OCT66903.1 hypothetical protein XELAEV_18038184mg [Xenopus laevis]